MPMKNIGKPNLSGTVKSGFKLMGQKVARGTRPERPAVKGAIGSNHQIVSAYGGKKKPKKPMY